MTIYEQITEKLKISANINEMKNNIYLDLCNFDGDLQNALNNLVQSAENNQFTKTEIFKYGNFMIQLQQDESHRWFFSQINNQE